MKTPSLDAHLGDPVMMLAQSLIGAAESWADMTDFSFQKLDTDSSESGTIVTSLVRNIQLLSALNDGQHAGKYDAVRSGLLKQCEELRVFFTDVINKQIISEVESR